MSKKITLIGAGLVGSLWSIYLAKRGFKVTAYERRPDLRKNRISAGRSINLALSDRGWRGLEGVGIADEIKKVAIPMHGRMIHNLDGKITYQPYGKEGQSIYSVSRGGLNCVLMDLAEKHGVEFVYNQKCIDVKMNEALVVFENTESLTQMEIKSDRVFSSDGAYSSGRLQMQLYKDRYDYQQFYLKHGYKELCIPPTVNGDFAMEANALHIWPRGQFMLIALPNLDKSFTCTLFFPFEGKDSFASINTEEKMLEFFNKTFPDAVSLMPTLKEDYFANPTSSLMTVKCFPWTHDDKLALIGDSAHAVVPFYGQGMNCGFEDCVVLEQLLEKYSITADKNDNSENWNKAFREYETLRKPDGDAIADLAVANFVEMRDKVADPNFLLQKKIEAKFSASHPEKWIPLYSMVTYSPHIRYSEALANGNRQEKIMQEIMKMKNINSIWDSQEVEDAILNLL